MDGRLLVCELDVDSQSEKICLCNVYAPNKDSPTFFDELDRILSEYSEHKIIIGDFNLVLDEHLDSYGEKRQNNKKSLSKLKETMTKYCLTDLWRDRNENVLRVFRGGGVNPAFRLAVLTSFWCPMEFTIWWRILSILPV